MTPSPVPAPPPPQPVYEITLRFTGFQAHDVNRLAERLQAIVAAEFGPDGGAVRILSTRAT